MNRACVVHGKVCCGCRGQVCSEGGSMRWYGIVFSLTCTGHARERRGTQRLHALLNKPVVNGSKGINNSQELISLSSKYAETYNPSQIVERSQSNSYLVGVKGARQVDEATIHQNQAAHHIYSSIARENNQVSDPPRSGLYVLPRRRLG